MLGFIAGFPYLGGMSREIAAPRLKSPRVKIEGGAVGIAGEQTGIYPVASPGGWQLIFTMQNGKSRCSWRPASI